MNLSEILCDYLNGFEERPCDVLPETLGSVCPAAGVFLKGDTIPKTYVDGTSVVTVPFEVRIRINAVSPREKLDILEHFSALAAYVKAHPLQAMGIQDIKVTEGWEKTAIFPSGEEEYGMGFCVKVKKA